MNPYHAAFLSSPACEDLVGLFARYKAAAKEVTESWGILEAAKTYIPNLSDKIIIVAGDGCAPRTGALFAYYTKARVFSVDPMFNLVHWQQHKDRQRAIGYPIQRLHPIKKKIEDIIFRFPTKEVVFVWPHSHAPMDKVSIICQKRYDVAMPCCVPIPACYMRRAHVCYADYNIMSPRNTIHIWS